MMQDLISKISFQMIIKKSIINIKFNMKKIQEFLLIKIIKLILMNNLD